MPGRNDIQNDKNANTNGLDKNPQNINKKGRPVSIRNSIIELLEKDGVLFVQNTEIINSNATRKIGDQKVEGIEIKLPTVLHISNRLLKWAMSKKGNDGLKAIQMVMEQIDGKPMQKIQQENKEVDEFSGMTDEEIKDKIKGYEE